MVEDDMPAVRHVAKRFGLLTGWPAACDFLDAERAFGTLLIASADPRAAQGFGGTLRREAVTHLGDLFVLREHQSSGVGRALLSNLLAGDGPKVTFASSDPRAVSLYVRYGLRPWCPLLYLTGPAAGLPAPPVREARVEDVAPLDARAAGGARPDTLAWYAAIPGVTPYTTDQGYAFARVTDGQIVIGPAGGETPQDCAQTVLGALAATAEGIGAGPFPQAARTARIAVPGVHPLVPVLIGAGWRISDMDTFMANDAALTMIHPSRYIPHPDLG
ncbi:GNAT family N-acetyltransferase [Acrocarpospora macrocephala]|uniref:GNAT family N-acetyltransferase n=1 Tax=Acrocarpospora macrocephala TaxID=150177 RepID=UPI0014781BF2|nr:GNAT family N-acetyltransferase [Acrocarpospora macrocephala]